MMKKVSMLLTAVVLALALTSCGGEKPKKVAEMAVQAELAQDYEKLYSMLSTEDRDAVTLENFLSFYALPKRIAETIEMIPEVKEVYKPKSFSESVVGGEEATVMYVMVVPDLDKIGSFSLEDAQLLLDIKGNSLKDMPEELQQKMIDNVKKNGVATKEVQRTMRLKREGDEWKVFMNLAKQIESRRIATIYDIEQE